MADPKPPNLFIMRRRLVLMAFMVLAAGCTNDTPVAEPSRPATGSTDEICLGEAAIMEWVGEQLTNAAFGAIDLYEAGDIEAAQGAYDTAAQIMDSLPEMASALDERCSAHIPDRVAQMNSAVASAQLQWDALQAGCRAGPGTQGFRCG